MPRRWVNSGDVSSGAAPRVHSTGVCTVRLGRGLFEQTNLLGAHELDDVPVVQMDLELPIAQPPQRLDDGVDRRILRASDARFRGYRLRHAGLKSRSAAWWRRRRQPR